MALTTIDERPALVVIDLQKGVLGYPTVHPIDTAIQNSVALANAFRDRGYLVVWVNVTAGAPGRTDASGRTPRGAMPAEASELADELGVQPGDLRVTKQTWGAFHNTALDAQLREKGVTQIVLTGVATSIGVESTARSAYEHGYNVVLAADAMTDMVAEAHANSVERIFPRLGEVTTTAEILEKLG